MKQQSIDEQFMARCIQIATNGLGTTYPNPFVGSVIVHNNQIIGEGFTSEYGGPHAEVNAIKSVKNPELLKESTLYVTLEPCSHFGKTPPCADLIIKMEIPRVVIGMLDPFSKVNGQGYLRLLKNGVDVTLNVLQNECLELNKRFITFHQKKRPYIILKWAQTEDGYMGRDDIQLWITNQYTKQLVHKWRTEEQGILVGKNTALIDNPQLNSRLWKGKDPVRMAIDKNLAIPTSFHLYDQSQPTIIFNSLEDREEENLKLVKVDYTQRVIPQILNYLYLHDIQSLIVEGGSDTIQHFIDANLWDEARILSSDKIWNEGILAPRIKGTRISKCRFQNDELNIFENRINIEEEF
jgi:diaminohydroxyphosphoribosylaminopyrimidine deaminase / 5-amino-6-(5-phosphoribosylamino)uracil reductase